jgi:hypothetical protein
VTRPAIILPIVLLATALVLASRAELPVVQDSYVAAAAPSASYGFAATLAATAGGIGACAPSEISYLRFDLAGLERPVRDAALLLEAVYAGGNNSGSLALYAVPNTLAGGTVPWQENTLTWNNQPGTVGMVRLAAVPVPVSAGPIRLDSQALTALLNRRATSGGARPGDDTLSLALQIEGCTGLINVVHFASAENSDAAGPTLTFSPPLQVWLPLLR